MMTTRRLWACAAVLTTTLTACEDPTDPLDGATFALASTASVMEPGARLVLSFTGASADGRTLDAHDVTWTTTDATTAAVSDGVVEAVAPGVVFVHGSVGTAHDSVRIRVRVPDLRPGEVAARAQRSPEATARRFFGTAFFSESILGVSPSVSEIRPTSGEVDPSEPFQALIRVPGRIEVGPRTLDTFEIIDLAGRQVVTGLEGIALYRLRTLDPLVWEIWLAVGEPALEIESVEWPAGPGLEEGVVRGSSSFEAAGLVMEGMGASARVTGQVADTTSTFYLEFETPLRHFVTGGGTAEAGGRLAAEPASSSGVAFLHEGGQAVQLAWVTLPSDAAQPVQYQVVLDAWTPTPGPGVFEVPGSGPEVLGGEIHASPNPWLRIRFSRVVDLIPGPSEFAVASGGTITVTEYDAPTDVLAGRMTGSFDVVLAVWVDGSPTGETFPLSGSFTLPVYPEGWR